MTTANLTIQMLSRTHLAGVRECVKNCEDRDTAEPIYRELLRLAHELSKKHGFQLETKKSIDCKPAMC